MQWRGMERVGFMGWDGSLLSEESWGDGVIEKSGGIYSYECRQDPKHWFPKPLHQKTRMDWKF